LHGVPPLIALVRHGEAGKRGGGDDQARPLTDRGWAQAKGLVEQLAEVPLARVLSSPYARCRQTVEPIAAARGLAVEDLEALIEGHPAAEVLALLPELAPAGAALCSHGDVIGDLVRLLVERGLVDRKTARWTKGSTWLLELDGSKLTSARYLPPPA
jgi:phosphohistidine phosphatase SixA